MITNDAQKAVWTQTECIFWKEKLLQVYHAIFVSIHSGRVTILTNPELSAGQPVDGCLRLRPLTTLKGAQDWTRPNSNDSTGEESIESFGREFLQRRTYPTWSVDGKSLLLLQMPNFRIDFISSILCDGSV